jgi:8-oxo-dGTP diphosphatase
MPPEPLIDAAIVSRGAVAVITNHAGQLLMHLRDDIPGIAWPGYWSILGGGCDPGEDPTTAIIRELDEEAGLVAADLRALFEIMDTEGSGQLLSVFAGTWDGDEQRLPLTEGVKLQFFAPEDIDSLSVPPHIREVLTRYHVS